MVGLSGVRELAGGSNHVCARLADGSVRCWGDYSANGQGQFGNGTSGNGGPGGPMQGVVSATGISGATRLVTGLNHT